jgi:hypothetical protein
LEDADVNTARRMGLILTTLFAAATLATAAQQDRGQASLTWLSIPSSPRDAALGVTVSLSDRDASTALHNPAGLTTVNRPSIVLQRNVWISDMHVTDLAVSYPLRPVGTLALTMRSMDYGVFEFTSPAANESGYVDLDASDAGDVGAYAIGLAFGRNLTDQLSIGIHGKYARENLGTVSGSAASVEQMLLDLGTHYYSVATGITLAALISNAGATSTATDGNASFAPPTAFTLGVMYDALAPYLPPDTPAALVIRVQGSQPQDGDREYSVGSEFRYNVTARIHAALRTGWTQLDSGGLTLGLGIGGELDIARMTFDYAYVDHGSHLGSVNLIGITLGF